MFEILEHTGDIRIGVRAADLEGLYRDAVRGMMTVLLPRESGRYERVEHRLTIQSADPTCLLVDFLNDALWSAVTNLESYDEVELESISDRTLTAIIRGRTVERFDDEIKAVTYHEAEIRRKGDQWQTNLVFDV